MPFSENEINWHPLLFGQTEFKTIGFVSFACDAFVDFSARKLPPARPKLERMEKKRKQYKVVSWEMGIKSFILRQGI